MAGDLGLVHFQSNEEIEADRQRKERETFEQNQLSVVDNGLIGQIRTDWEQAKRARLDVDERLLECLRRRNGEYSPQKLAQIRQEGGSEIYMQLTATKCRAAASWIRDIILPANEKPWGLEPTPVSEIPQPILQAIHENALRQIEQMMAEGGGEIDIQAALKDAVEDVKKRANEAAAEAAERMELRIEDQFAEGGFNDALDEFIDDFTTFPTAIYRGPVLERRTVLAWGDGWEPITESEVAPGYRRVSPFDFYPSPEATNCDDAGYLIERVRFTRRQLRQSRDTPGYRNDQIDGVLRDHGIGGLRDWLFSDSERQHLEGRRNYLMSDAETIEGLLYTGSCIGLKLLEWGMDPDIVDPLEEYDIEATLIGRYLVKVIVVNDPMSRRKYGKASFQNVPGGFWGIGLPELMSDIQDTCNATARAIVNNMAMSSGPMVEVNFDRLAPEEDADIYPWKTWQTKSSQRSGSDPAVRFFQAQSNATELMNVYNEFERKADDATNVPRYTYGNEKVGGAGDTFGGLSLLMDAASKGIKNAISHVDKVVKRVVEATWLHNMMYDPDQSIKGDCKVIARGSHAILMRERTNMLRNQFLNSTANEIDMAIIGDEGRAKLLEKSASELDIPDLVPSVDDLQKRKAQRAAEANAIEQERIKREFAGMDAKTERDRAAAEKARADAGSNIVGDRKTSAETAKIHQEILLNGAGRSSETQQAVDAGTKSPRRQLGLQGVRR